MVKKHTFDYDLIIIGSGASGSAAAAFAANKALRVAIVESNKIGGSSPNYGEIPIKAMLHAANLYDEAKNGSKFGIRSATLGYNYPSIKSWKNLAIKRTGVENNKKYYENKGVTVLNGWAHFLSPNEISVNRRHFSAKKFIIAAGSSWKIPKIPGLQDVKYWTPHTILDIIRPPKSLLVIGGGSDAVEIAQLIATFGTKVYLVEKSKQLLPRLDSEAGELLEKVLSDKKGVSVLTSAKVLSVEKDGLSKRVTISRGNSEKSIKVDEILIADQKSPMTDIGLENAGIKYDVKGIKVNSHLQTNIGHIYAAGEVIGTSKNTHTLIMEGQSAANNILARTNLTPDYSANPEIIFTNPSVATVGLSEKECKEHGLAINKSLAPINIISRSNVSDFSDGFVKIITNKKKVIIGASIVSPHAGEMIHELTLAVKNKLTTDAVASTPHHFLSWSEAIRIAASKI